MYRQPPIEPIACPRCKKKMPPLEITACACGVWVSALAASFVMTEKERWPAYLSWWRHYEQCPHCGDRMTLFNVEPGLLQGCELHGYFVDADTVEHTSLAVGFEALQAKLTDETLIAARREELLEREHKTRQLQAERAARERREQERERQRDVEASEMRRAELRASLPVAMVQMIDAVERRLETLESEKAALESTVSSIEERLARLESKT